MESFEFDDYLRLPGDVRERMFKLARTFRKWPTPSEVMLWQSLRGRKLNGIRFRRQQPLGPFVVDFVAMREWLVVEIYGGIHETQKEADRERQALIESVGFRFVRLRSDLVERQLPQALELIRLALSSPNRAPSPGSLRSPPSPTRPCGAEERVSERPSSSPSPPPNGVRRVGEGAGG